MVLRPWDGPSRINALHALQLLGPPESLEVDEGSFLEALLSSITIIGDSPR